MKGMVFTLTFPSVRDLKLISHLLVKIRHLLLLMSRKNISTLFEEGYSWNVSCLPNALRKFLQMACNGKKRMLKHVWL